MWVGKRGEGGVPMRSSMHLHAATRSGHGQGHVRDMLAAVFAQDAFNFKGFTVKVPPTFRHGCSSRRPGSDSGSHAGSDWGSPRTRISCFDRRHSVQAVFGST